MINASQQIHNPQSTRTHLAQVATHLFAHYGYDGTTIRDIATQANVTKPVLYYYFQSKENLFNTLIHEAYVFFFHALREILDSTGDFVERLRKITNLYLTLSMDYPDTVQLLYQTIFGARRKIPNVDIFKLEKQHFQMLGEFFTEGIHKNQIRPIPVDAVINYYLGAVCIYVQNFLFINEPIPKNIDKTLLDLVLNGIGGGKP